LPYTHFWHQYVQQHANGGGTTLTFNPAAAFAAAVCLFFLACWAAYQLQSRCGGCGAIPARCRCRPVRERERG
jgi:hypothetical protein